MIGAIAEGGARRVEIVSFVSLSSDFGVEEEVIVLLGEVVGRFAVESLGDQAEGLELAEHREATNADRHFPAR